MSNADIVRAHYDASRRGDLPGMVADFAHDIVWTECAGFPTAGTYIGPEAVIDGVFGPTAAEWDGFAVSVDRLVVQDDAVVAIGRYTATHRGTRRCLDTRTVHLWTLADGRIIGFEQIADSQLAAEAAGA
ncbi:nuclear transport factor 2 family protein [Leifsonia poae]|uniref:nuclear transport factor 2 family protein n=1 Tax=Leifsonia poae TaxID=110933 RepID=UPI001CBCC351|nr:nuclear transport factor 2 family protein [Leifsonia poae]